MEIDYALLGLIALALIIFILWLVRRNIKDEKKFEKDSIQSELKPEKHGKDHV
ncbi:hypothetical protein [Pedobacter frigoris]|uniref:hypothetical protein n=1 Tax=Pedobacter frigoris TaxID=2571272 RepID=UPI00145E592B|nr:hypothetical protein [Pedobacter frigoris]